MTRAEVDAEFRHGMELFNAGEYFECHEAWENVWREVAGDDKVFVQSLIQFAVALHHVRRENLSGARTLLARAADKLRGARGSFGVNADEVRFQIALWADALESGARPWPQIKSPQRHGKS